eukprot:1930966-Rhodomonas_salina.7
MADMAGQHRDADKLRRRTHLPRDSQGFIRVQWLENFFETLYASNERINIPYTVVFQYRRIYAAYYTDADGYVQKIDKIADLGPEQVIEVLRKLGKKHGGASQMGCRAYYVYSKKQDETFPMTEATSSLSVEYFDDSSLTHFLTYRGKENNGMLQQFQEPVGSVATIRAYWTAHYCQLETRMNVHKTDDTSIPLEQRAVTFEGELYHSRSFPISSKVEGRIKDLINRMVGYLTDCLPANVKIQLMMLNFRIGANGKIWFLYCNCLKLYDESLESIGYGRDSQGVRPNSAKLVEASIPPQGLSVRASKKRLGIVCPSTDTRLGPFEKYKVKVQAIFLHFLWHGPTEAWAKLGRSVPDIPLENGKDPGMHAHILRVFLTMDLRPSPLGRPFFWNAEIDEKSLKERDPARWTAGTKEAHADAEKVMEKVFLEKPDIKAAYKYWEATMVFLISQEQDNLTQENFRQQRIRPAFLQSELHCCEHALLVYNSTMEEVLEVPHPPILLLRAHVPISGPDCVGCAASRRSGSACTASGRRPLRLKGRPGLLRSLPARVRCAVLTRPFAGYQEPYGRAPAGSAHSILRFCYA